MSEESKDLQQQLARVAAAYRAELTAAVDLPSRDLDELEDHLLATVEVELTCGATLEQAVHTARTRLGEPRALGAEMARVRAPFGPRIGRARAFTAAALLLPYLVSSVIDAVRAGSLVSPATLEVALGAALFAALVARLSWARMLVLGSLVSSVAWCAAWSAAYGMSASWSLQGACYLAAAALLAPWRRREVTIAGASLALLGPAYAAAAWVAVVQLSGPAGAPFGAALGPVALGCVLLAGLGALVRSRLAPVAALGAAVMLGATLLEVVHLTPRFAQPVAFQALFFTALGLGVVGATLSGLLAARSAQSLTGTLRGLRA